MWYEVNKMYYKQQKEEILKIDHLHKNYDELTVLKDINLTVNKGEVVVIVGPSGCGKSTLLRCINGLSEYCPH